MTGNRLQRFTVLLFLAAAWCLTAAGPSLAATAGQMVLVEGQVDLLKKGQLPTILLKVGDGVDPGDVIRTKPDSRAQVKFIDDTTLTIGPESRVGIEEYMYDAKKNQRHAVLNVFRGLVHAAVDKVIQVEEPDFVVKTHTGILGVRGTKFYVNPVLVHTDLFVEHGKVGAKNIQPEVKGEVIAPAMHFVRIGAGLPPTLPLQISEHDIKGLNNRVFQRTGGQTGATGTGTGTGTADTGTGTGTGDTGAGTGVGDIITSLTTTTTNGTPYPDTSGGGVGGPVYVPPIYTPATTSYSFTQEYTGVYLKTSSDPYSQGLFSLQGSGFRTSVYPGTFTATFSFLAVTNPPTNNTFSYSSEGLFTVGMNGTVTGTLGNVLTGTMSIYPYNPSASPTGEPGVGTAGGTRFNISGNVSIYPNGNLTFSPTSGTWTMTYVVYDPTLSQYVQKTVSGSVDPSSSSGTQTALSVSPTLTQTAGLPAATKALATAAPTLMSASQTALPTILKSSQITLNAATISKLSPLVQAVPDLRKVKRP